MPKNTKLNNREISRDSKSGKVDMHKCKTHKNVIFWNVAVDYDDSDASETESYFEE